MRAILKRETLCPDKLEIALMNESRRRQSVAAGLALQKAMRLEPEVSIHEREQGIECFPIPVSTSLQQLSCVGVAAHRSSFQPSVWELHHGDGLTGSLDFLDALTIQSFPNPTRLLAWARAPSAVCNYRGSRSSIQYPREK